MVIVVTGSFTVAIKPDWKKWDKSLLASAVISLLAHGCYRKSVSFRLDNRIFISSYRLDGT